jgi:hypothetical protein
MNYLATDAESGGVAEGVSLLTAWFGIYDTDGILLDELDLCVKPENGIYHLEAEGMEVNKIDLIQHDKAAVTYKQAGQTLYAFLKKWSKDGAEKLMPVGHNLYGDVDWYCKFLLSQGSWKKFVSYRLRDTGSFGSGLKDAGILPHSISGGLGAFLEFFDIVNEAPHTAKGDGMATMKLWLALVNAAKGG